VNNNKPQAALTRDETKEAVKEAFQEWLDKKYATFGKWTLCGLGATILAGLLYAYVMTQGFHIK
jgi:hypothetical protein